MTSFELLKFLSEKGCVKVRDKGEYRAAHIKLYATDQLKWRELWLTLSICKNIEKERKNLSLWTLPAGFDLFVNIIDCIWIEMPFLSAGAL